MIEADAANLGLLLLRSVLGVVMLAHGINHIFGGGKIEGTAGWFESLGMRPGRLHAWLASIVEVVAGAMLVVGLVTPLAAAGAVGVMVVAWITNHLRNGFFIFRPGEGYEYVMTLTVVGIVVGLLGPGEWSLDEPLDLLDLAGGSGLVIVLAAGVGGALALLLAFWRPEPDESGSGGDDADD
ncbi:MAG: DoxX family protein [Actinomycetota bacterium]